MSNLKGKSSSFIIDFVKTCRLCLRSLNVDPYAVSAQIVLVLTLQEVFILGLRLHEVLQLSLYRNYLPFSTSSSHVVPPLGKSKQVVVEFEK